MNPSTDQIETILVPVDFSDATDRVIAVAKQYARAFGSRIVLLHVCEPEPDFIGYEPGPVVVRENIADAMRRDQKTLDELKAKYDEPEIELKALQIQGPAVEKIVFEAREQNAGLVVMGSHGHGAIYNLLVGSVTEAVLKHVPCPVLIVPTDHQ
jgi:nucleotide-binding universal stress UspA family protein